jgi:SAM-dependent methyltransferase
MSNGSRDAVFAGSIPQLYATYFAPMLFEPYAEDLANRLASTPVSRVLEIACGTGVVTRQMASAFLGSVAIVATDLNQAMLDAAASLGTPASVEWRRADAQKLPFDAGTFDAVVCQFGVMFFPDKPAAFAEARRVLKSGGTYLFSVWDHIGENEFADTVTRALETIFPDDPPRFMIRTPHGYSDRVTIERDLAPGGWRTPPSFVTVAMQSRAASAQTAALAFCQGTPLRNEIEARDASRLGEATDVAARALAQQFGDGAIEGKMQAHIIALVR